MSAIDHQRNDHLKWQGAGAHDPDGWISEGDGLHSAARITRHNWVILRRNVKRRIRVGQDQALLQKGWTALTGLPRASMLLLGYSAEMYLKAGLAKAYIHCSTDMFDRDIKRRFGHHLDDLAREIDYPALKENLNDFLALKNFVLVDARYPVTPKKTIDYYVETNSRTSTIWSRKRFASLCCLVRDIRDHVMRIDRDEKDPSVSLRLDWGEGGYIAWRACGHLWQRLTFRPPNGILIKAESDLELVRQKASETNIFLYAPWETFIVQEDKLKETKVWRDPRSNQILD